jgi:hypothetical protein
MILLTLSVYNRGNVYQQISQCAMEKINPEEKLKSAIRERLRGCFPVRQTKKNEGLTAAQSSKSVIKDCLTRGSILALAS